LNEGHDAFPEPLLGDPGLTRTGKTENILMNEASGIQKIPADGGMRKCAGIPQHFTWPGAKEHPPDKNKNQRGKAEYFFNHIKTIYPDDQNNIRRNFTGFNILVHLIAPFKNYKAACFLTKNASGFGRI
jgi:hypothetical protein